MCSFMVCTDTQISTKKFEESFKKISYRGPDMSRIEIDNGLWGFHRLAIMDLSSKGMQPFDSDGYKVVCNGEIFNFRKIRHKLINKGYKFMSNSDCEILGPMYEMYKEKMFKMLDAEFACVILDKKENTFIAGRDPMGIRPMFYGYTDSDKIVFASEAKALIDICKKVYPFPPGHYYKDGKFIKYYDISKYSKFIDDEEEIICKNINKLLRKAVLKRVETDAPLGYLLSGGLDSSLVCSIASKSSDKKIKTFAIGMDKDAIDLKYARIVADYINSDHTEVIFTKEDIFRVLRSVIYHLETWDITTIRASIGMFLLTEWIHENTDIKVLLTGEVSDELFGYKYTDYAPSSSEFQKESEKRIKELYMYDVLRADRCISGCSLEARVPFADKDFVNYVMGINPEKKMNTYGIGKYLLRKAFEGDYLPDSILYREKAAFSDAVGHSMVDYLKEYAEELYSDQEYLEKISKYTEGVKPFTKESLMYREIFDEYYEGHDDLIKDYWMPNKSWKGCSVDDPSARVLSNYGNSGK